MDIVDYTRKYTDQYKREGAGWFEPVLVGIRRGKVVESLERYPHGRVLEVGCGLEPIFEWWSGFERLTVVEPCPEFVARARAAADGREAVEVVEGFLEDVAGSLIPPRGDFFDFIVVSSLLHEVSDPERLLATLRELSGPDTVLHFNVPNVRSFHRLLALEMGLIGDLFEASETERHFRRHTRFDRARLEGMLSVAGFEVLRFGTYFVKPFTHGQMEKVIDAGILPHSVIYGLDQMICHIPEMGAEMFAEARRR